MRALKVQMKKEFMEAMRKKKLLVLAITALFFALGDPVMLRFTPYLLEEFSGTDVAGLVELSHFVAMKDFGQDMSMIFTFVLTVIISGTWLQEIKEGTAIIPLTKGVRIHIILLAKILVYSLAVTLMVIVAYGICYYYAGIIFGFGFGFTQAIYSGLLMAVYYTVYISFLVMVSTVMPQTAGVIFVGLIFVFGGNFLAGLVGIDRYMLFGLQNEAGLFPVLPAAHIVMTVVLSIVTAIVMYMVSAVMASHREAVRYR